MRFKLFQFTFVLFQFWVSPVRSAEGFTEDLNAFSNAVLEVWNSTVQIHHLYKKQNTSVTQKMSGSGVVVKVDKLKNVVLVATNAHVVPCPSFFSCRSSVEFELDSGYVVRLKSSDVEIVYEDRTKDLAILKLNWSEKWYPVPVKFVRYQSIHQLLGADVIAIGYPDLGLRKYWSVAKPTNYNSKIKRISNGIVSAIREPVSFSKYTYYSEVTSVVEMDFGVLHNSDTLPGNSGGPLVDAVTGELVGLVSAILNQPKDRRHCEFSSSTQTPGCYYFSIPSSEIELAISAL